MPMAVSVMRFIRAPTEGISVLDVGALAEIVRNLCCGTVVGWHLGVYLAANLLHSCDSEANESFHTTVLDGRAHVSQQTR